MKKKDIAIQKVNYLRGPNIWTYRPVIEAWVDIGALEDFPSNTIPGLYERLTAWLPTLIEHRCGIGERGGFLERLRTGTWSAHILEHITLELQSLAGMPVGFGKARETSERGVYKVAFRTRQEEVGRAALQTARDLLMAAIEDRPFDVQAALAPLRDMVDRICLGPSTAHIVDAATDRRIPAIRLTDGNLVQLGYGARQRRIWTAETDRTSAIAEGISRDKDLTKSLLKSCGVPVPEGQLVDSPEEAWEAAQDIGLPVAVKPYDGNHGRGVSLDLVSREQVIEAYALAEREGSGVIVEQSISGIEHRLLVVGKKMVAAAAGETATVTGDGKSTIAQLIDSQINTDPRRGMDEEFPLEPMLLEESDELVLQLARQGYTGDSVPAAGQKIQLQRNGNVAFDVTDRVHPDTATLVCLAARVVGLDIAGVDLVVDDISRPLTEQRGAIIEVNAGPGLLAHTKPASGQPRPVGTEIVSHLFAEDEDGRIPVVGITGTRDTTRIAQLIDKILCVAGRHVGLACAEGLYLNQRRVRAEPSDNWEAGQSLLINRSVQAAIIENGARQLLAEGLSYDRCSVGIVTDVAGYEALADFDIRTPEQMFNVIRTQVDVVLPDGYAVLNAEDHQAVEMAELCDGDVIFYALSESLGAIAAHRDDGGRTVFCRGDDIVLAHGSMETAVLPCSVNAAGDLAPHSVLAAVAAAWALNVSPELICAGMRTFAAQSAVAALRH
ncbi:cyanophycin synthetase [Noviherbaspirillum pedocola]|uniref:Cyanophycin synthetase n=1 Tax=Noviherbaspirillum pedocola TaxID=2801341 RepID=A0A934SUF1_9BURK|nr:cyanophycin synthetase [Noviherbaspirillum pedocola]MBK4735650.1 cyanophycin synthetase [Noviherbaspirillum pedocola]